MSNAIYIINPTSTLALNRGIDLAVDPLRIPGGPKITPILIQSAPAAIESQSDSDYVAPLISRLIRELDDALSFVIACFSDPGLHGAREATTKPVYGIAECGLLSAMMMGQKVGVLSILKNSIPRHWRMYGSMGITSRVGGDLPIEVGVVELERNPDAFNRLVHVGSRLRDDYQCDVLVLGCAGMASYQKALAGEVGIPVVDPVRAAAGFALAQSLLHFPHKLNPVA